MNRFPRQAHSRSEMIRSCNEAFHVYNRGVNKQVIFHSERNYRKFLELINQYFNPSELLIMAFCLMPNHFHLLIQQLQAFGISGLMEQVCGDYAKVLNHSLSRSGHLFQGRYGMKWAKRDDSVPYLASYIHQNPLKAGLVKEPEDWPYSSCQAYIGAKSQPFLDTSTLLSQIVGGTDYRSILSGKADPANEIPRRLLFRE